MTEQSGSHSPGRSGSDSSSSGNSDDFPPECFSWYRAAAVNSGRSRCPGSTGCRHRTVQPLQRTADPQACRKCFQLRLRAGISDRIGPAFPVPRFGTSLIFDFHCHNLKFSILFASAAPCPGADPISGHQASGGVTGTPVRFAPSAARATIVTSPEPLSGLSTDTMR